MIVENQEGKKMIVFVVSCNDIPAMIFDTKVDAIKWCSDLWCDRMQYRITQTEMRGITGVEDILFKLMAELDKSGFWDKVYVHTHSSEIEIKTKCMACVFEKFAGATKR